MQDDLPTLEAAASRPLAETENVPKPCRAERNGTAIASEGTSPASSGGLMPAPPPRTVEASPGASCSDLPQASSVHIRDNPDSTSDSAVARNASNVGASHSPTLKSATSSAVQQPGGAQTSPASTMMTRSSHRAHISTPRVDMRVAIQELTNVKANAAAGSAAAAAAAKAAAAAAAATNASMSSVGHSFPDNMTSGFLERLQSPPGPALGIAGAMQARPWANQPVD
jgi:hypothetical protein